MKKKENNKIKVLALQSYIDYDNKDMFYKWYEEEVQKKKGIK